MTERVRKQVKKTAEAERQEDCTNQVGRVKLFTLETVILSYNRLLHSDVSDIPKCKM